MDDYYSYKPRVRLPRALAICGLPGAGVGQTAQVVSMLTGLRLIAIDRQVEHVLAGSVELAADAARIEAEQQLIPKALAAPSPPVLALSSVTLSDPTLRELLAGSDLLHLRLSLDEAVERIRAQAEKNPRHHWGLREGGSADEPRVRTRLRWMGRFLEPVEWVVDVGGRDPLDVGRELAEQLVEAATPPDVAS